MQALANQVRATPDASLCGVGWNHAMPGIVKQQSCQQVVGLVAHNGAVLLRTPGGIALIGEKYQGSLSIAAHRIPDAKAAPRGRAPRAETDAR
jgi:hypothetical protein